MLVFATELPVNAAKTMDDLLQVCRRWICGSPHSPLSETDLDGMLGPEEWSLERGVESILCLKNEEEGLYIGGMRYIKQESTGLEWTSEIVGARKEGSFWVSLRVYCDSLRTSTRLPRPKKPYIIRQFFEALTGAKDGRLATGESPIKLRDRDIPLAATIVLGKSGNHLPVIYVSAFPGGTHFLDVAELARQTSGMAHVVIEPNRAFSFRLMHDVSRQNPYNGAIGIFWPDGGGKSVYRVDTEERTPRGVMAAIVEELRTALINRQPRREVSWSYLLEIVSRRKYEKLKATGSTELNQYVAAFDAENEAKSQRLEESQREIARLRNLLQVANARVASQEVGTTLKAGAERELFRDEIRGIVLETLAGALNNCRKGSRRQHILQDLISVNSHASEARVMDGKIKAIFKTYRSMGARDRSDLEEMGFVISEDGKHYKAVFHGDPRYTFTIAKTSSDHRGGKNLASDMIGTLL